MNQQTIKNLEKETALMESTFSEKIRPKCEKLDMYNKYNKQALYGIKFNEPVLYN